MWSLTKSSCKVASGCCLLRSVNLCKWKFVLRPLKQILLIVTFIFQVQHHGSASDKAKNQIQKMQKKINEVNLRIGAHFFRGTISRYFIFWDILQFEDQCVFCQKEQLLKSLWNCFFQVSVVDVLETTTFEKHISCWRKSLFSCHCISNFQLSFEFIFFSVRDTFS